MSNWKDTILAECVDVINGYAFKSGDFLSEQVEGSLPVLKIKNVANGDVHIDGVQYHLYDKSLSKVLIENKDTLLALTGNHPDAKTQVVGQASRYKLKEPSLLNQRVAKLQAKDCIHPDFLYYFMKDSTTHDYLASHSSGSANQANISKGTVENTPISLPPIEEQEAIAEVLSSLDDKIDLLHKQNQKLEELTEILFMQWFLVEAEEDWVISNLDEVLTVKGGTTPNTSNDQYWNGEINWTSPKDITTLSGLFLFDTERKITEKGLAKISSGLLPKGTLLMTSRAPVGVLAFSEIPLAINQGYIAIIADKNFTKEFIYLWLRTNMDYVISYANGSTFLEISKSAFKSLEITIPPSKKRSDFQKLIEPAFLKIKSNEIQIQKLEKLRNTLLPKLISGEVRVKMKA